MFPRNNNIVGRHGGGIQVPKSIKHKNVVNTSFLIFRKDSYIFPIIKGFLSVFGTVSLHCVVTFIDANILDNAMDIISTEYLPTSSRATNLF